MDLGPGSYAHMGPGVDHDVAAPGPEVATSFYLFIVEDPDSLTPGASAARRAAPVRQSIV
jgi:hypothetical protein